MSGRANAAPRPQSPPRLAAGPGERRAPGGPAFISGGRGAEARRAILCEARRPAGSLLLSRRPRRAPALSASEKEGGQAGRAAAGSAAAAGPGRGAPRRRRGLAVGRGGGGRRGSVKSSRGGA